MKTQIMDRAERQPVYPPPRNLTGVKSVVRRPVLGRCAERVAMFLVLVPRAGDDGVCLSSCRVIRWYFCVPITVLIAQTGRGLYLQKRVRSSWG